MSVPARYDAPMRHVGVNLKSTPTFQPHVDSQPLLSRTAATSAIRPVNGLMPDPVSALFLCNVMRARRYSAPTPRAKRPSEFCHAIAGSTAAILMLESVATKRPTHGACQFVRRPNGVISPTPNVRLFPIGITAY